MTKLGETQYYDRKSGYIGRRVELPAWSDQWMRGARFGTVARVIRDRTKPLTQDSVVLCVKVDHPQIRRQYRHFASNFRFIRT